MSAGRVPRGGAEEGDDTTEGLRQLEREHIQDIVDTLTVEGAAMGLAAGRRAGATTVAGQAWGGESRGHQECRGRCG
jgi:beta-phosphoglucomutase-like phosphatase (HAD superfamily)